MVRPRFHNLSTAQQESILRAALSEFSAHGFGDASLNRIIDAAGISKGSMYYYFDGKADLYLHVIRDQTERLLDDAGPFPVPSTRDPDEFWAVLGDYYARVMRALLATPALAALLREWTRGAPPAHAVEQHAQEAMLPWLIRTLDVGQDIGAVRTDLPADLLLGVVLALGQAIDVWLISRTAEDGELDQSARTLIDLIRRSVSAGPAASTEATT